MIGDVLSSVLGSAPELGRAPELAMAAAQAQDPVGSGQVLAHTVSTAAQDRAYATVSARHGGLFHAALDFAGGAISKAEHTVGDTLGGAMHLASLPLAEVQHAYRALHDIEARHGPVAGLLEGLGIAAAGVGAVAAAPLLGVGALAAGTVGVLGGEAAGDLGSRLFYRDSWDRTANGPAYQGVYDRQTGQYSGGPVSIGRDVAAHVPHPLRFISGITDGLTDLALDPVALGMSGVAHAVGQRLAISTVDRFDSALSNPVTSGRVMRAFDDIAGESSPLRIGQQYPKWQGVAPDLANLTSRDQVVEYFRGRIGAAEAMTNWGSEVPNLPLTRVPFKATQQFLRTYDGPGSAISRVFTLLPADLDQTAKVWTGRDFDPSSGRAGQVVYRTMRFSQSDQVAREVADNFLAAAGHVDQQRTIWKNGIAGMLQAKGINPGDRFFDEAMQALENTTPTAGGPEGIYGLDSRGRNISLFRRDVLDGAGQPNGTVTHSAALLENQTGRWAIPDYMALVRAERAQGAITNALGAADDFFYHHFTDAIFKRGALLTGGFALRIAAAEAIPAAFREGVGNLIRGTSLLHIARNEITDPAEVNNVTAAAWRLLGKAGRLTPEQIEFGTQAVADNGGGLVVKALDADAHSGQGVSFLDTPEGKRTTWLDRLTKKPSVRSTGGFEPKLPGGQAHLDAWHTALAEMANSELGQTAATELHAGLAAGQSVQDASARASAAVRDLLDSKPESFLSNYERHFQSTTEGVAPHEDWGRMVTEYVKALTGHPDDLTHIHMGVLHDLSEATATHTDQLAAIDPVTRPVVKGRVVTPEAVEGPIARIAQLGYHHVLDPTINFLSREPIYGNELLRQHALLQPLMDEGVLSADDALRIAQIRSVVNVTPFIHNPLERSQFAQLARNFMPFYFAQTQAYRRVGRLLAEDPGAFRKFQLASTALHDIGTVTTDDNGQPQFVYPGGGFLAHASLGALGMLGFNVAGSTPVAFSGDVRSLNTIFPFNEEGGGLGVGPIQAKLGPIVAIPLHALQSLFPAEFTPVSERVLGPVGSNSGLLDQFVPNTPIRNLLKAQGMLPGGARQLQNAMVQTIQALTYRQNEAMRRWTDAGHQPDETGAPHLVPSPASSPQDRQQFIDRVKNQARILLYLKAAISTVGPAAPQVSASDLGLQAEFRNLITSVDKTTSQPLGMGGAVMEFLHRHPDATPYTVFGSKAETEGAYLPANHPAMDFLTAHGDLLSKYPYAGAWFIPQTAAPYDQGVYNEQLALGLRLKKTPEQVFNDIYIAQGNDQFYNVDLPAHQKAITDAAGDPAAVKAENTAWSTYLSTQLGPQNPIWWADFGNPARGESRKIAVQQIEAVFAKGDAPAGRQTDLVRSLLDNYQVHAAAMTTGRQDSWSAEDRAAEEAAWKQHLDQLAVTTPELSPVIHKVFYAL